MKCIASSSASLPKGDWGGSRKSRLKPGIVLGTRMRSMRQQMRRILWAASLCLPLPVDNEKPFNWNETDEQLGTKGTRHLIQRLLSAFQVKIHKPIMYRLNMPNSLICQNKSLALYYLKKITHTYYTVLRVWGTTVIGIYGPIAPIIIKGIRH